jgi:hypothetical protein
MFIVSEARLIRGNVEEMSKKRKKRNINAPITVEIIVVKSTTEIYPNGVKFKLALIKSLSKI